MEGMVARLNICVEGMVPEARQKAYRMSQLIFTDIGPLARLCH